MRSKTLFFTMLVLAVGGCQGGDSLSPEAARRTAAFSPVNDDVDQVVHVDHMKGGVVNEARTVTTEAKSFRLESGGIHWLNGGNVEYIISGTEAVSGGNAAIEASEVTWDSYVTPRTFSHTQSSTQVNPCTGRPNTVGWSTIDGPGNIVAVTATCFSRKGKQIVGFEMAIDQEEPWSIGGSSTTLDVQNTVTHEFGHAVGLGHVSSPNDVCLTMYPSVTLGEIQKRTLGLGDKLGMARLYGSTDVTAGTCGT